MTGHLSDQDVDRLGRMGLGLVSTEQGLALLDAAIANPDPALVGVPLDRRGRSPQDPVPPLLRGLIRTPARQAAAAAGGRLSAVPAGERDAAALELVRAQAAAILGHAAPPTSTLSGRSRTSGSTRSRPSSCATGSSTSPDCGFRRPSSSTIRRRPSWPRSSARSRATRTQRPARKRAAPDADPARALRPTAAAGTRSAAPRPEPATCWRPRGSPARRVAGAARGLTFRAWVLRERVRLARAGCRLVVETKGLPPRSTACPGS